MPIAEWVSVLVGNRLNDENVMTASSGMSKSKSGRGASRILLVLVLLSGHSSVALAVDGSFDPTWAGGGSIVFSGDPTSSSNSTYVEQIIVESNGRLLIGGPDYAGISLTTWFVGELQPGGTPVLTFGASNGSGMVSGCYLASALCNPSGDDYSSMAMQSDGRFGVLGGGNLVRLSATASALDTAGVVGGSGYVALGNIQINDVKGSFGTAYDAVQTASGKWLAAGRGTYSQVDMNGGLAVIQLNSDFPLDSAFAAYTDTNSVTFAGGQVIMFGSGASELNGYAQQVLVQNDGRILLVGLVYLPPGAADTSRPDITSTETAIARLNADGTPDLTYGAGTGKVMLAWSGGTLSAPSFRAAKLDAKGRLLFATTASPTATGLAGFGVARVLDDGTLDPGFGSAGVSYHTSPLCTNGAGATALAFDSAGRIVVAGFCEFGVSSQEFLLERLHGDDGTLDTGFGIGGFSHGAFSGTSTSDFASDIVIDASGHPVFGGASYPTPAGSAAVGRVTYDLIRTNGFEAAPTGRLPGQ